MTKVGGNYWRESVGLDQILERLGESEAALERVLLQFSMEKAIALDQIHVCMYNSL